MTCDLCCEYIGFVTHSLQKHSLNRINLSHCLNQASLSHQLNHFMHKVRHNATCSVYSHWASWACDTTHWEAGPQYTLAKAMVPGWAPGCGLRPRYTEYSVMAPAKLASGSQERWAPSALYTRGEESCHGDVPHPTTTPSSLDCSVGLINRCHTGCCVGFPSVCVVVFSAV